MAFASLEQLKSRVWDTRDGCIDALKINGFKPETANYRPAQNGDGGKWYIEELDPEASQEVKDQPLNTGKQRSPLSRIKQAKQGPKPGKETLPKGRKAKAPAPEPVCSNCGKGLTPANVKTATKLCDVCAGREASGWSAPAPEPAKKAAAKPETKKTAAKPEPVKKAAAKKAAADPDKKRGKSSDPSPDELPAGFDTWLIAQLSRSDGVLRTEITAKAGVERRWMGYLEELGKKRGFKPALKREGRFTRFVMTKA